jgi:beta-carotene hydroxylase
MAFHKMTEEEVGIVSKNIPNFSWFLATTGFGFIAVFIASTIMTFSGAIPLWLGTLINLLSFYSLFDTLHDCMHGQVHGKHKKLKWMNKAIGVPAGLIVQQDFYGWTQQHMAHHKSTNVKGQDPNWSNNTSAMAMWKQTIIGYAVMHVYSIPIIGKKVCMKIFTPRQYLYFVKVFPQQWAIQIVINWSLFFTLVFMGYGKYTFWLWMFPSFVNRIRIHYLFVWTPHKNNKNTESYIDTAIHIRPLGIDRIYFRQVLDYHLIHHLYPSVPSNRLRRVYKDTEHILKRNGTEFIYGWGWKNKTGLITRKK